MTPNDGENAPTQTTDTELRPMGRFGLPVPKTRREHILAAAMEVVGRYGFRRSSMDDIATAAGLSRPSLYNVFSNKRDIFRGVVAWYCAHALETMEAVLDVDKGLGSRLERALLDAIVEPHATFLELPHGDELAGMKSEMAEDLFDQFGQGVGGLLMQALLKHGCSQQVSGDISTMIGNGLGGMKARNASPEEMREGVAGMVRIAKAIAG